MDLQNLNKIFSNKISIDNRKKIILIGIIIISAVLILSAINLQMVNDGNVPSESKEKLDAGTEINNNDEDETSEFIIDNSSVESNQDNPDINGPNDDAESNSQENNEQTNDDDDSPEYTPSSGSGPSFSPPSNNGGGSGSSGSDDTSTGEDNSDQDDDSSSEVLDCLLDLPDYEVDALVDLVMNETYFITDLTGIFGSYDIQNGSFETWCIDYGNYMNYSLKKVQLYSSYCPPDSYQLSPENWSAVNYILNNKPDSYTYIDIQTAIWYYVNFGSTPQEPTAIALDIINDVESNNGSMFIPGPNEIIAVIVESNLDPGNDQLSIIEHIVPSTPVSPRLNLEKTANVTHTGIGGLINYTYMIENTGDVTLESLILTDDKLGIIFLNKTILEPEETAFGYKSYIVTEEDIPGPIINTAIISANTTDNQTIFAQDNATVQINYNSSIVLNKEVNTLNASIGDEIIYSFTITNTGEVNLYNLTLVDDHLGLITFDNNTMLAGEIKNTTISYTVIDEDLPGPLVNYAIVTAKDLSNKSVTDNDTCSISINYNPSISITKESNIDNATLGSIVNYTYVILNTGDVSLESIIVVDDKIGLINLSDTSLAPSESVSSTASYIVECIDMKNTTLVNIATVTAKTILNDSVCDNATEIIELSYHPNVTIEKTVQDMYDHSWKKELTVIEQNDLLFNITIHNTGDEPLHNFIILDKLPNQLIYANDASIIPDVIDTNKIQWNISLLAQGESLTITYYAESYTLGTGMNNASTIVDICTGKLIVYDNVEITVLPCPTEVWVKHDWNNQSDVDEYDSGLTYRYNAFKSINYAINAVCECATVHVLPGVYGEQVFINKNLSLIGENTETTYLHSGTNPETIHLPESSETITPVILAYGGTMNQANMVLGSETISVSIQGFTFLAGSSDVSTAVAFRNVQSGCVNNAITNTSTSNVHIGIQLWNCSSVLIDKNYVENSENGLYIDAGSDNIQVTHNWFLDNDIGIKLINNTQEIPYDISINYNYIDTYCSNDYGLVNEISTYVVNATHNWWGSSDGPTSAPGSEIIDPVTGRIAESVDGEYISGKVHFDRWSGVGSVPFVSQIEASVGSFIYFDASNSWAEAGYIGPEDWNSDNENFILKDNELSISQYKWDFGDGSQGYEKSLVHQYDSPGNYTVSLRVRSSSIYLDRCDGFRPSEDGILYGYAYFNIRINE